MPTKKDRDRSEALDLIRESLAACGPDGNATLLILDDGGRPSSSGRTHKLTIHVLRTGVTCQAQRDAKGRIRDGNERPTVQEYLTINAARAMGWRLSKDDCIVMGGYGYSRPHQIASSLARAVGHALYCDGTGAGLGDVRGWVQP